jgi:ribosomal 50S subunit-recycling heat shock protein
VANDACDTEHVCVNGRRAKASYDVKEGDVLEITFGQRTLKVRVLTVKDSVAKADAASMYEIIE